jgi:hypothetical protein
MLACYRYCFVLYFWGFITSVLGREVEILPNGALSTLLDRHSEMSASRASRRVSKVITSTRTLEGEFARQHRRYERFYRLPAGFFVGEEPWASSGRPCRRISLHLYRRQPGCLYGGNRGKIAGVSGWTWCVAASCSGHRRNGCNGKNPLFV